MCPISDAHVQIFLGNLFGRATHPVQTSQQSFCTATKKDYAKKYFLSFRTKLGNGDVKVREFLALIPLTLSRRRRGEEEINIFSPHLTPHFQSMLLIDGRRLDMILVM